jgi:AcrR family transcriptional regulator
VPKRVDHQERRSRIADAVCRLLARDGFEAVSLRQVATEAGVSMGQVQHYFMTKDELLAYTFDSLSVRVEQRLQTSLSGSSDQPPPTRDLLRALLRAMVPLDPVTRAEAPLWVAYAARAIVRPELAERLRTDDFATMVAGLLRQAQNDGRAANGFDPDLEAATLLALADGLMIRTAIEPHRTSQAAAVIDYHLDRLFPK